MVSTSDPDRGQHERGAVLLEYGLLGGLIAVVVALAVGPVGPAVSGLLDRAVNLF